MCEKNDVANCYDCMRSAANLALAVLDPTEELTCADAKVPLVFHDNGDGSISAIFDGVVGPPIRIERALMSVRRMLFAISQTTYRGFKNE